MTDRSSLPAQTSSTSSGCEASGPSGALKRMLDAELDRPVPAAVSGLVDALRAQHGPGVAAVLFYGSCLRDGEVEGRLVDLYLLVDSYAAVHASRASRLLNRLIPPNVYYFETRVGGRLVRAKYAIIALGQLARLVQPGTSNPYFWARLAQPMALAWCRDERTRAQIRASLARAVMTLIGEVQPMLPPGAAPADLWRRAFELTYSTELRSEGVDRARLVYEADRARYDRLLDLVPAAPARPRSIDDAATRRRWRRRRWAGKAWSVLRLVKAGFTFDGGADYLAYKIERHSGVRVEIRPWHRRHPHLAALVMIWGLYRRGAFR
jgi:hypothetical protein